MNTPKWLADQMGERERNIADSPNVRTFQILPWEDPYSERLPPHQLYIVDVVTQEYFWVDSLRRQIIG